MADKWEANDSVYENLRDICAHYHQDLIDIVDEIAILFQEKSPKEGGIEVPCAVSKANDVVNALASQNWKFIITIGEEKWTGWSNSERNACLDRALCAMAVERDEASDLITKWTKKGPSVSFYSAELDRHGAWWTDGETEAIIKKKLNVGYERDESLDEEDEDVSNILPITGTDE